MTTYYFRDPEESLRQAKLSGKQPGKNNNPEKYSIHINLHFSIY